MIDPSQLIAALVGVMSLVAGVLVVGAFFSLGRSGYRKD